MQKLNFEEAVETLTKKDPRYEADAYGFVRDALDFTIQTSDATGEAVGRHVSGPELLEGFRRYSLQEFGPMVTTVLDEWGIRECQDVGNIVFNLISVGVFGRAETDRPEDFRGIYTFDEAFVEPFLPTASPDRGQGVASGQRSL